MGKRVFDKDLHQRQKAQVLALAKLQRQLHQAFANVFTGYDGTLNTLAKELGLSWVQCRRFLDRECAACSGNMLERTAQFIGQPGLIAAITEQASGLSSRLLGMSLSPNGVIELVFDLQEFFFEQEEEQRLSAQRFATMFQPHEDIVAGLITFTRKSLRALEEEKVLDQIIDVLYSNDYDQRHEQAFQEYRASMEANARELDSLVEQLRPDYDSLAVLAKALNTHESTLHLARRGSSKVSEKNLDKMVRQAKRLINRRGSGQTEESAAPAAEATEQAVPVDVIKLVGQHGGIESVLGVPFSLTADGFTFVEGDPGQELLLFTQRQIRLTRALLNLLAQLKDDQMREVCRSALGPEIEELWQTLRAFTFEFPNRMMPVLEAERQGLLDPSARRTRQRRR